MIGEEPSVRTHEIRDIGLAAAVYAASEGLATVLLELEVVGEGSIAIRLVHDYLALAL